MGRFPRTRGDRPAFFLAKPVHRGPTAREAPLRLFARISEFYRQALGADPGYNGVLTHNPMRLAHRHGEFLTHWGYALRSGTEAEFRASFPNLSEAEKDELVRKARRHPV